ncbi:MAG: HEAT repeat domain-containing protein [Phycisphaerales bacterium]|nr:MAG: HEAT repeat domain-containing protein [Phycisphaerales bacterium]
MEERIESKHRGRFAVAKKILGYGVLSCLAFLLVVYFWACFSIRSSVKQISAEATEAYPGDRIEALMKYAGSENHSLRQRNRAVWALGQIGDERALPALRQWYVGGPCDHDNSLCQRELQTAIKGCEGSFNATAWLPR